MKEYFALAIFCGVYALIIAKGRVGLPIWASMLAGAALMLLAQVVSIEQAFRSVNLEVIAFLFGMFTIVAGLEASGTIRRAAVRMLAMAKTPSRLLMVFMIGMGGMAAFLVNDTVALVGVPFAGLVSARAGIRPVVLLLGLAFGITVGSIMTPIGNPQNLLIATESGIGSPFLTFLSRLAAPTIISLAVTFLIVRLFYRRDLAARPIAVNHEELVGEIDGHSDRNLARLSTIVMICTLAGFIISEVLRFRGLVSISLGEVAMMGAAAMYALTRRRVELLKKVNYPVLVFFASMFIVMSAMWSSGAVSLVFGKVLPNPDPQDPVGSAGVISAASILMSQVLSNVPFVTIYNFVMANSGFTGADVDQWMMLAAASTIAGNLTILGAASNVIVIEAAEARGVKPFSYFEFFRVGVFVTSANLAVFYVFIVLL